MIFLQGPPRICIAPLACEIPLHAIATNFFVHCHICNEQVDSAEYDSHVETHAQLASAGSSNQDHSPFLENTVALPMERQEEANEPISAEAYTSISCEN